MTIHDLLLPDNELSQLTNALANTGFDNPLDQCLAEAEATVAFYTSAYEIGEAIRTKWVRRLAIWAAYRLAGPIPDNHQISYEAAMKELEAVRDGKFSAPAASVEPEAPAATGAWGSEDNIFEDES